MISLIQEDEPRQDEVHLKHLNFLSSNKLEEVILYYDNGSIKSKYTTLNGKLHGKYEVWHENGQKEVECTYVDGELHGKYESWYINGQKTTRQHNLSQSIQNLSYWYTNGS